MAQVVGVHGIWQHLKGPHMLLGEWEPALRDGMLAAGVTDPERVNLKVAFYGGLFLAEARYLGAETLCESTEAASFQELLALELWRAAHAKGDHVDNPDLEDHLGPQAFAKKALNKMSELSAFAWFAEQAMSLDLPRQYLDQVDAYLHDPEVRSRARSTVHEAIGEDTRVVVGHSLGSVVAYEALCDLPEVRTRSIHLVTLGSPLGLALLWEKLDPPPSSSHSAPSWVEVDVFHLLRKEVEDFPV